MADLDTDVQKHSVHTLVFRSLKRTHDTFLSDQASPVPEDETARKVKLACKLRDEYNLVKEQVDQRNKKSSALVAVTGLYPGAKDKDWAADGTTETRIAGTHAFPSGPGMSLSDDNMQHAYPSGGVRTEMSEGVHSGSTVRDIQSHAGLSERYAPAGSNKTIVSISDHKMLVPKKAATMPKPSWHAPWKLYRVISGHHGWVRCVDVEPGNEWFVTGAGDRVIKIWDLASGTLKLSLTGHVSTVRGVKVSPRQPYLFSVGEDKQVKCWDLEYNKVTRHYHGHLSAIHAIDIHPTIDVIVTCGRDATARVWDIRTKAQVHCFSGHTNTVADVKCQAANPQVVTSSHDCTLRLWDLAMGKSQVTLTNHKKSVRSVVLHPNQYTMASSSPDNIKQWKFPDGNFIQNLSGHNAIVNTLALNEDNVLVSSGGNLHDELIILILVYSLADNGSMYFWDWKSGYNFQRLQSAVQPGSIDSEAGIYASLFDKSGSRLITCEADKTIKIYKEDETATEETHPVLWKPDILRKKRY
ncbi:hypothetical protein CAPTEDRAFT_223827 [Capitella teleta]|uniref:Pleiotropic regulator 1 n=1 Tax=Capitella teleta TaxID=283909 RepID=R7TQ77_CAPTE|nr:hypothetical protein CAPTEDRAFT_223827 [Capitella teleta]|eukprot:ELT96058.1 hypothetical protein CAPTEDRAFT_223827 [Capitella teleta]